MFTKHMQQGGNVWYCPSQAHAVQISDGTSGHPTYSARICPVCGVHAKPEKIS